MVSWAVVLAVQWKDRECGWRVNRKVEKRSTDSGVSYVSTPKIVNASTRGASVQFDTPPSKTSPGSLHHSRHGSKLASQNVFGPRLTTMRA